MRTLYVKRARLERDVLGQYVGSFRIGLMRVTVNRLRKAQWEWVSCTKPLTVEELNHLDISYPIIFREGMDFELRKGPP